MPAETDKIIREKIAGLDILPPGIKLNNVARWSQLEHALQPAKKRTTKWYYAAAVFLGIATIWLIFNKEPEHHIVTTVSSGISSSAKSPAVVAPQKIIAKKGASFPTHLKRSVPVSGSDEAIAGTVTAAQNTNTADLPEAVTAVEAPVNLVPAKPVVTVTHKEPVKPKRLKIIHLNELRTEQEMIYTHAAPSRKMQMTDETPDESAAPQINKAWWQAKPKPVTTIIDHP